ncbi:MAG: methyltransferase domain-containing protein [Candidatus Binatia bacterium]
MAITTPMIWRGRRGTPLRESLADALDEGLRRSPFWLRRTAPAARFVGDLALRERYLTGRRFTNAIAAWMAPNRGHAMYDTWLGYALSTNVRGAEVVRRLGAHKPLAGARALDVGCAYGGSSVAFAEAGGEAVGIDVDPNLLGFAALNVADKRARVTLANVDVTDGHRMRELGRFDFITCSDVIEHVRDVPATLANLAAALNPGGLLHLQIPNGRAAALVLADGHFGAFAITLLERDDALRYFAEKRFGAAYDVFSYLTLERYPEMLARDGVRPVGDAVQNAPVDGEAAIARVAGMLGDIEQRIEHASIDPGISPATRAALQRAVRDYLCEVRAALVRVHGADRRAPNDTPRTFVQTYGIDCWDLIAFKTD